MKIFTIYLKALLLCITSGVIVAIGVHYYWLFFFFLIIPIILGVILSRELLSKMTDYIAESTIITIVIFLLLLFGLIIAAICDINEKTFFGTEYAATISSGLLFTLLPLVKIPEKWAIVRKDAKRFPY